MTVITNNVPRLLIDGHELTRAERVELDYYNWPGIESRHPYPTRDGEEATFFRYRGHLYDVGEFMPASGIGLDGWDGYSSDTFFSATVIRFVDDGERVVVGRIYS